MRLATVCSSLSMRQRSRGYVPLLRPLPHQCLLARATHAVAPQAKVSEDDMRRPTCWLCEDGTILEVGNRRAKAYEKHLFYNQINAAPTANVQRGVGSVDAA